jgi:hypothetical protein
VADVHKHISRGNIDRLLAHDELVSALATNDAFAGWREGVITFAPTFKFAKGTDRYVGLGENGDVGSSSVSLSASVRTSPSPELGVAAAAEGGDDRGVGGETVGAENAVATTVVGGHDKGNGVTSSYADARGDADVAPAAEAVLGADGGSDVDSLAALAPDGNEEADTEGGRQVEQQAGAAGVAAAASESPAVPEDAPEVLPPPPAVRARERPRTPAWTDRVLFKRANPEKLHKILYTSSQTYFSDHVPVLGCFLLNADVVDEGAVAEEVDRAQKALDLSANNAQPRCTVDGNVHDVGRLRYTEVVTRTCTIENVGEV